MNTSLTELEMTLDAMSAGLPSQFKILILYEDQISGDQSLRLHRHLIVQMKGNYLLETYSWDLKHPEALEGLVEAIEMADMIIVAGQSASELPVEMQAALNVGLAQRRVERGALVAFLGRDPLHNQAPSFLHFYLQELARMTGLKFFPGVFDLPEKNRTYNLETIRERAYRITPTLERILHRHIAPDHCAINN